VIKLNEDRVDVAVYVNFTGIPAGKKVTYILPFMYKPENFKIAESSSMGFYADNIEDVDKEIDIQNDITNRNGSEILQYAWSLPLSIPIMTNLDFWVKRTSFVNPYQIEKNPGIKVELVKIIDKVKYNAYPINAVLTITGAKDHGPSGCRGVVFTYSQQLTGSEYKYISTDDSAVWKDFYVSCPDNMVIDAERVPCLKITDWELREAAKDYFMNGITDDVSTICADKFIDIYISNSVKKSVWQGAYLNWVTDTNLVIKLENRKSPWKYHFAKDITDSSNAVSILLLAAIFSWMVTIPFLIKPHCTKYPEKSIWKELFIPYLIILAYFVPINAVIITWMAEPFYGFILTIVFIVARLSSIFTGDNPVPSVAKMILLRFDLPFPREEKILAGKCWLLSTGLFIILTRMLYLAAR
jgi:hypothetical protein